MSKSGRLLIDASFLPLGEAAAARVLSSILTMRDRPVGSLLKLLICLVAAIGIMPRVLAEGILWLRFDPFVSIEAPL